MNKLAEAGYSANTPSEPDAVRQRYARRANSPLYALVRPYPLQAAQEKERAVVKWIHECGIVPAETRVLEIGCGGGGNLLDLIRLGFRPEHLTGNELLEDRCATARHRLPAATRILCGDASQLDLMGETFDVVLQSTVFTSILDDAFQQKLADRMWQMVKPGGGVLYYDFVVNNPRNPDVRGVPLRRVRKLFSQAGSCAVWRLTLAPPIGRRVSHIHPSLYSLFNLFPLLRTHVLCWLKKTSHQPGCG
jgi:SAM-dependent methyltransferase